MLLRLNDLFSMKRAGNASPSILLTDRSRDLKFTAGESPITETGCLIFRGPSSARLFNTKNDWVVYLTGLPEDRINCGSGGTGSNFGLAWRDSARYHRRGSLPECSCRLQYQHSCRKRIGIGELRSADSAWLRSDRIFCITQGSRSGSWDLLLSH